MSYSLNTSGAVLKLVVLPAVLCCLLSGCQFAYFLTNPDKKQKVPAEYNQIGNARVAVVVWAEQATLDYDPYARHRVCDAVTYNMKREMPNSSFVEARTVSELQERSGREWEGMSNEELSKELKCDVLVRIDLLEYTTRAQAARELRKGRLRGTVNLYDCKKGSSIDSVYQTELVSTYPTSVNRAPLDLSDQELLRETVSQFGLAVARKFYDHEVAYERTRARDER